MSECPELRTRRLRLRCWRPGDRHAFAAINADARAMRFLYRIRRADRPVGVHCNSHAHG